MSDSQKFQENMSLFLRNSPLVHHTPDKCFECEEFHYIADDLTYCVRCHHPISADVNEHSGIILRPNVVKPSLISRLFSKVASK